MKFLKQLKTRIGKLFGYKEPVVVKTPEELIAEKAKDLIGRIEKTQEKNESIPSEVFVFNNEKGVFGATDPVATLKIEKKVKETLKQTKFVEKLEEPDTIGLPEVDKPIVKKKKNYRRKPKPSVDGDKK